MSRHALLADVGGTNVRFALADTGAAQPLLADSIRPYAVADFPSLADAAARYLRESAVHAEHGVFAIAGRIEQDRAQMTNHAWEVSRPHLEKVLGLKTLQLVNDFVAQAMAVRLLRDADVQAVGTAPAAVGFAADADATSRTFAVLGPGTGLGVGALLLREGRYMALATEGGHVGFAPGNAGEVAVLQQLIAQYGHVSNERLVSGGGLVNLHRALTLIEGDSPDERMQPADVTAGAEAGDSRCREAIDLFCEIFGSVAGDMALALGAWNGVYLSGGLVPRLLGRLQASGFRRRFEAKGRYADAMAGVPTLAIVHEQPGLLGAAALACDLAKGRADR
ncbi:glucokinase [Cognatiluteimonas telluris]|uniref:glucokinase n=1 Tax=Cognatiluteimonas telluris TaxID=1104775 RepID=UPI001FAE9E1A|nr:glucokinase [Lysobacter telluris]